MNVLKELLKLFIPADTRLKIRALKSKKCAIGKDSLIHHSVQMLGVDHIAVGNNTCVSENTWFNVNHFNVGEIAISLGNNCFIGRRNFFSSGKKIVFGEYVLTTNDCRFICSSHIIDNPLLPYIASGTTSTDQIIIGTNCFFGSGAVVMGNITIGHGSVIGAAALVTKDIPPFSIVVGYPGRITKRYSFSKKAWLDISVVTESDLAENPNEEQYLALIKNNCPDFYMPIIAMGSNLGNL